MTFSQLATPKAGLRCVFAGVDLWSYKVANGPRPKPTAVALRTGLPRARDVSGVLAVHCGRKLRSLMFHLNYHSGKQHNKFILGVAEKLGNEERKANCGAMWMERGIQGHSKTAFRGPT